MFTVLASTVQRCPYIFFSALCKGCVILMLLCSRINVETMKGSVTQLGSITAPATCLSSWNWKRRVRPHPTVQGHESSVQVSSNLYHSESCTSFERIIYVPSVTFNPGINPQRPPPSSVIQRTGLHHESMWKEPHVV